MMMLFRRRGRKSLNSFQSGLSDRLDLTLPKGQKDVIKAFATAKGKSVNLFVADAVTAVLNGTSDSGECVLSPQSYAQAAEHVKETGESISDFIGRAITDTIARDKVLKQLK